MAKIRALIVDDEPLARERLRELLRSEPDVEIVAECANGRDAVRAIDTRAPDLVFLDVQMPELDGFGVLDELTTDTIPAIVFVTAFDEFALRAFDVHALDYLLKPFDRERFARALDRARAVVQRQGAAGIDDRLAALLDELSRRRRYAARLVVKDPRGSRLVRARDLDWVEADGNYLRLHAGPHCFTLRETMAVLEARLDPDQFLRIHRSTIVNVDRITGFEPFFHGDYHVKLVNGHSLTLSRTYRAKVEQRLGRPL